MTRESVRDDQYIDDIFTICVIMLNMQKNGNKDAQWTGAIVFFFEKKSNMKCEVCHLNRL